MHIHPLCSARRKHEHSQEQEVPDPGVALRAHHAAHCLCPDQPARRSGARANRPGLWLLERCRRQFPVRILGAQQHFLRHQVRHLPAIQQRQLVQFRLHWRSGHPNPAFLLALQNRLLALDRQVVKAHNPD